jgi:hypothetical protein
MFEVAHLIGAFIGKYNVYSVSILGFTIYKKDKKIAIKFSGYDGMTGETKIAPKSSKSNPIPYLMMGTLFFVVELISLLVAFNLLKAEKSTLNPAYFILIMLVVSSMIYIYNILPFKLDTITDGYRLRLVSNPKNKEAFNELLKAEYEIGKGNKDIEIKIFTEITDFTAELNLNKVYLLLNNSNYKEAEELLDVILTGDGKMSNKNYIRAKAQKIFIEIVTKDLEEAKKYYETNVTIEERKTISEDTSMECIRTYILMSGLFDNTRSETVLALDRVNKAFKRTNKARKDTELKLYNYALKRIIEVHPKWELNGYLLKE